MSLLIIFKLLGSLALLMFGMKAMSEALQKMAGPQLRHVLGAMTTNRFTGVLTGMLVTVSVQSSTATTVMTVSFVNAGLLTLAQAISVIMGANIGTTLTAWIMAIGTAGGGEATTFDISFVSYIGFFVGIILIYMKKHRYIGDFLFGLGLLLLGLTTLKATGTSMDMGNNPAVTDFFMSFDPNAFSTTIIFLLLGGVLTFCVQSSAAVMALTMLLCSTGAMPIYQGIALVMGENIGTTITSNLAALSANTSARRAALSHMFFNFFGVFWILFVFRAFVDAVCGFVGYDVEMTKESAGVAAFMANAGKLNFVLAAFHTCFNVANTFILIWFIPQIEKLVCWIIKPKKVDEEEDFRLHFITSGIMKTPELSVLEAQKEIQAFAMRMQRMFTMVQDLLTLSSTSTGKKKNNQETEFNSLFSRIEKYENISDNLELESIGDSCYNMARTISRKYQGKEDHFNDEQYNHLHQMMSLTDQALTQMNQLLSGRKDYFDVYRCYNTETEINNYRDQLKSQNIMDINNHSYTYAVGTIYMDLVNACEKLADYVVNVVEARTGTRMAA